MARRAISLITVMLAAYPAAALASPGPPPPEYIVAAAVQLVPTLTEAGFGRYSDELATDLTVFVDGRQVALSKATWLAQERHRLGKVDRRVLGYVTGQDAILVIDQVDDRSDLPDLPNAIFDPRYRTRAVQYRFGADHLVHTIRITQADGVMQRPD